MRKRIEGLITAQEQNLKDTIFRELSFNDPTISFKGQEFVGSFYNIQNDNYLFVGVDKRLLSYQGFISYIEFESDVEETIQDNVFILYKDGVLVIEIKNIEVFSDIVNISVIKNYQDNITISDIDEMNEISFSKYFEYILKENGFANITEQTIRNDLFVDLTATKDNQIFYFEFKLFKNKRIGRNSIEQILDFSRRLDFGKLILVTNAKLANTQIDRNNIIIIDREKLDQLTRNSNLLNELIE